MDTPSSWSRRKLLSTAALFGAGSLSGYLGLSGAVSDVAALNDSKPSASTSADRCLSDWLDGANGYEGYTERYAPGDEPSVTVGASPTGTDSHRAFDPVVTRVVPGTTVTWDWTGYGGPHNVVAVGGDFDSGDPVRSPDATFEHTFEQPGTYQYSSKPNREDGMRGVVEVAEPPESDYPAVDEWLAGVEGYDGTLLHRTEYPAVTITVGSAADDDGFDFSPAAVAVAPGTTVTWVWTGDGGPHTVAFEESDVGLDDPTVEPGVHLEHTFEETGVYRYACGPHESLGQRGAIVVTDDPDG